MPPPISKYDSGTPVAMLKARDAQGPVVTISQPKKPSFTFGSPTIADKPVGGFAYLGYELVKGGDSAPPTGSFAHAADARSTYALKSGKLDVVERDIAAVRAAVPGVVLKVILETALLERSTATPHRSVAETTTRARRAWVRGHVPPCSPPATW